MTISAWFAQQSATPIAMGELFVNQAEYVPLIRERLIDFIRVHISDIGGLSMARKLAAFCEFMGVRTAWHGPGDVSPVGPRRQHAPGPGRAQLRHPGAIALPRANPGGLSRLPGGPRRLHVVPTTSPGWGIDIDEELAAKYPFPEHEYNGAWPESPPSGRHRRQAVI